METDGAGDWVGNRPGGIEFLEARVKDGGDVELRWSYRVPYGRTAPDDFGIYYGSSPDISAGSPQATEAYAGEKVYTKTLSLSGGQTYYFAATARITAGAESQLSRVVGPLVADDTAPATPTVYADTAW
jgi:hypothetical protein